MQATHYIHPFCAKAKCKVIHTYFGVILRASSARRHACGVGSAGLMMGHQVKLPMLEQAVSCYGLRRFDGTVLGFPVREQMADGLAIGP